MSKLGDLVRPGRGRDDARPRLSVVVPVYNVEQYLAACLDSLRAQPFTDFEVILVDDGSTDGSTRVARRYARRDRRFRLVRQSNAGLGAARNAGVRASRGELLTFLDSDDTLPPDAYSAMVGSLDESGSDFAIGMLKRDEGSRRFAMPRMRDNHRVRRIGIALDDMPRILADVFAVNKVFRRAFWDSAGLEFPEGIRYEDQPTLTRAFLAARAFDVLPETVYLWRIRGDGSSITQRRDDIADLRDRILTKRSSTEALLDKAPHLHGVWQQDILPVDMWEYFRAVPGCSDEYWSLLRAAVDEFWSDDTVPFERTWVPVQQRLMGWLVARNRRHELEGLIAFLDDRAGDVPVALREGRVVALLPGLGDPDGPSEEVYVLGSHELRWEGRLIGASWSGPVLRLDGFALLRNVPTAGQATELTARLVGSPRGGGEDLVVDLDVEAVVQPRATGFVGRASQNYDACGFSCHVDAAALATRSPEGESVWRLALERRVDGLTGGGGVTSFVAADVDLTEQRLDVPGEPGTLRARLRPRPYEAGEDLVLEVRSG